jgi:hypothetical protein
MMKVRLCSLLRLGFVLSIFFFFPFVSFLSLFLLRLGWDSGVREITVGGEADNRGRETCRGGTPLGLSGVPDDGGCFYFGSGLVFGDGGGCLRFFLLSLPCISWSSGIWLWLLEVTPGQGCVELILKYVHSIVWNN